MALRSAIALVALLGASSSALAVPAVTVSPTSGPPTAFLTVHGSGYGANQLIDIYFDTTDDCVVAATGAGAFTCTFRVPQDAQPQQHWVSAVQRLAGTGASKPFTVSTDMAQFHGGTAAHTGYNPYENTLNVSNVSNLDALWQVSFGVGGRQGSPVVAGGKVYVSDPNTGKLYAFYTANGAPVPGFGVSVGGSTDFSTPAVANGRVYIGAFDGKLHAYNALTGAAVSGFPKTLGSGSDHINSSPSVAYGNVYVGCDDGRLYAFNALTGVPVSGFPVDIGGPGYITGVYSSPTVSSGKVYIGSNSNNIYAFDALTGAPVGGNFPVATAMNVAMTVAASGQTGYYSNNPDFNSGVLSGFSLSTGTVATGFPMTTSRTVVNSPTVAGGKVFAGTSDDKLNAYFTHGGLAWSKTLDNKIFGSPMIANGVVYANTISRLYAISAATGAILWSTAGIEGYEYNSPVVANGILFFASSDGILHAFSVNGLTPSARLPGGALGVKPALSSLKPNYALKPTHG